MYHACARIIFWFNQNDFPFPIWHYVNLYSWQYFISLFSISYMWCDLQVWKSTHPYQPTIFWETIEKMIIKPKKNKKKTNKLKKCGFLISFVCIFFVEFRWSFIKICSYFLYLHSFFNNLLTTVIQKQPHEFRQNFQDIYFRVITIMYT